MKKNNWITPIVIAGFGIHSLNNRLFSISKEKLRKKQLTQRIYNWKFGSISYRKYGAGNPLLLIHDTFSGASSIEFDRIINQLAKKHEVYSLDLLGYGFSERSNITYTAYLYVQLINDFIHEVIESTGISVITSGNSNIFALFASQQERGLINRCIMLNPGDLRFTSMNPSQKDKTLKYLIELPFIGTTLYNILHNRRNYKNQFDLSKKSETLNLFIENFYLNAHFDNANARYPFASYFTNYLNLDVSETIKESNISLFIINGENREVKSHVISKQYTDLNPSIECEIVKNTSNFPHIENPYSTYDLINLYLRN
jgi:pimeloyl-ACP methyl ester carboxylesterase